MTVKRIKELLEEGNPPNTELEKQFIETIEKTFFMNFKKNKLKKNKINLIIKSFERLE